MRWELRPNALECAFDDGGKSVSPIGKPVVGATRAYGEVFYERSLFISRFKPFISSCVVPSA